MIGRVLIVMVVIRVVTLVFCRSVSEERWGRCEYDGIDGVVIVLGEY